MTTYWSLSFSGIRSQFYSYEESPCTKATAEDPDPDLTPKPFLLYQFSPLGENWDQIHILVPPPWGSVGETVTLLVGEENIRKRYCVSLWLSWGWGRVSAEEEFQQMLRL